MVAIAGAGMNKIIISNKQKEEHKSNPEIGQAYKYCFGHANAQIVIDIPIQIPGNKHNHSKRDTA